MMKINISGDTYISVEYSLQLIDSIYILEFNNVIVLFFPDPLIFHNLRM